MNGTYTICLIVHYASVIRERLEVHHHSSMSLVDCGNLHSLSELKSIYPTILFIYCAWLDVLLPHRKLLAQDKSATTTKTAAAAPSLQFIRIQVYSSDHLSPIADSDLCLIEMCLTNERLSVAVGDLGNLSIGQKSLLHCTTTCVSPTPAQTPDLSRYLCAEALLKVLRVSSPPLRPRHINRGRDTSNLPCEFESTSHARIRCTRSSTRTTNCTQQLSKPGCAQSLTILPLPLRYDFSKHTAGDDGLLIYKRSAKTDTLCLIYQMINI